MACDHNFARIPDDENTEGGGGRESDQSYAEIPDEENNEALEPGGERRSVDKTDLLLTRLFWLWINLFPTKNFGSCGPEHSRKHHHMVVGEERELFQGDLIQ